MKLSVIIPFYNREETAARCLDSVLRNKVESMEVICVDDGSTDKTLSILKGYAKKDKRVRVLTQPNSGPANARNLGLKNVRGEYVTFVDSDDTVSPYLYKEALKKIKDVDLVVWGVKPVNVDRDPEYVARLQKRHNQLESKKYPMAFEYFDKTAEGVWNKLFKMSIIKAHSIQFPPNIKNGEDICFSYEYAACVKEFYYINKPLYLWLQHTGSLCGLYANNLKKENRLDNLNFLTVLYHFYENNNLLVSRSDLIKGIFDRWILYDLNKNISLKEKLKILKQISKNLRKLNPLIQSEKLLHLMQEKYEKIPQLKELLEELQKQPETNKIRSGLKRLKQIHEFAKEMSMKEDVKSTQQVASKTPSALQSAHQRALAKLKEEEDFRQGKMIDYNDQISLRQLMGNKPVFVWEVEPQNMNMVFTSVQSFLDNVSSQEKCSFLFLVKNAEWVSKETLLQLYYQAASYQNVRVFFLNVRPFFNKLNAALHTLPVWVFIPTICAGLKRVVYVKSNMVALQSIEDLFKIDLKKNAIAAALSPAIYKNLWNTKTIQTLDPSLIVFNIPKIKEKFLTASLQIFMAKNAAPFNEKALLVALFEGQDIVLDERWNYPTAAWCQPANTHKKPFVIRFNGLDPQRTLKAFGADIFWQYARKTPVYEKMYADLQNMHQHFAFVIELPYTLDSVKTLLNGILTQTDKSVDFFYRWAPQDPEILKYIKTIPNMKPFNPKEVTAKWTIFIRGTGYFKDNNALASLYTQLEENQANVYATNYLMNQFGYEQTRFAVTDEGEKNIAADYPVFHPSVFIFKTDFLKENVLFNPLMQGNLVEVLNCAKRWKHLNRFGWVVQTYPHSQNVFEVRARLNRLIMQIQTAAQNNLSIVQEKLWTELYEDLELRYLATQLLPQEEQDQMEETLCQLNLNNCSGLFELPKLPKISLITPCFNGEKYLKPFLDSVLKQSYPNIQLIFIDDGSTDQTKEIFDSYLSAFKEKKIEVIYRRQKNKGQAAAVNMGLKLYNGAFLTWPDADDILYPNCLFKKAAFLINHPDIDMVTHALNAIDSVSRKALDIFYRNIRIEEADPYFTDLIDEKNILFPPIAFMVRSSSFRKALPSQHIYPGQGGQNLQMLLPIAYFGKFGYIPETLASYIQHADSHSRSVKDRFILAKIHEKTILETLNEIPNLSEQDRKVAEQKTQERTFKHFRSLTQRPASGKENCGCSGCSACANICPVGAITMKPDEYGFLYPSVDLTKCIRCYKCIHTCPGLNPVSPQLKEPISYVAKATDDIRKGSTSGGIFTVLARYIIENGGYVCGAALQYPDLEVKHVIASSLEELEPLRRSKYVQSNIHFVLKEVKELLDEGKTVLFSGTPCQIIGLKAFLKKEYQNLWTVDIVCHGVPSQALLKKYLNETYPNQEIKSLEFRPNILPWGKNSTLAVNGQIGFQKDGDLFTKTFLNDFALRGSCYVCPAANLKRAADLTIGDFWGIDEVDSSLRDFYGTSIVLQYTSKGKALLDKVQKTLQLFKKIPYEKAIARNPNIWKPSPLNPKREAFLQSFRTQPLQKILARLDYLKYDAIILNYWHTYNYGAILTAFALQEFLKIMTLNVALSNYIVPPFKEKNFYDFINQKLSITYPIGRVEDFSHLNKIADVFITGSDQVFNPIAYKFYKKDIYLLDFVAESKKKLAFSASFGDVFNQSKKRVKPQFLGTLEEKARAAALLSRFDAISTREASGVKIAREMCPQFDKKKIQHIVDPVFLISKQRWLNLANEARSLPKLERYYLVLIYRDNAYWLRGIKENTSVPLWEVSDMHHTPQEFLNIILNAEAIITNSFHAICFSMIFHKKFVALAYPNQRNRIEDVLKKFKLQDVIISSPKELNKIPKLLKVKQNFKRMDKIIADEQKKAKHWIWENIFLSDPDEQNVSATVKTDKKEQHIVNRNQNVTKVVNKWLTGGGIDYNAVCLNYWYAPNYGALLTAYAGQVFFKSFGLNIAYPNYLPPIFKKLYFQKFILKRLNLTEPLYEPESFKNLNKRANIFITGSDQVFNPKIYKTHGGDIYLLDFVAKNKKKVAFSASFGDFKTEKYIKPQFLGTPEETTRAAALLSRFDAISIRENSGVKIAREMCPQFDKDKIQQIMDPVFLINKKLWIDLAKEGECSQTNYYATISYLSTLKEKLSQLKSHLDKPIIDMSDLSYTPEQFLNIIMNSDGVITSSFHAVCFGLIFHKPVVFVVQEHRVNRILGLFQKLKLKDTILREPYDFSKIKQLLSVKQNFKRMDKIIAEEQEKAKQWVRENILLSDK